MEKILLKTEGLSFSQEHHRFALFLWSGDIQDLPVAGRVEFVSPDSPNDTLADFALHGFVSVFGDEVRVSITADSYDALLDACEAVSVDSVQAEALLCREVHGELYEESIMLCDDELRDTPKRRFASYEELALLLLLESEGIEYKVAAKDNVVVLKVTVAGKDYIVEAGSVGGLKGVLSEQLCDAVKGIGEFEKSWLREQ